jgi:hypothetical protein
MKKHRFLLSLPLVILSFLLLPVLADGQTWQWSKQLGSAQDDYAHDIVTDASGNMYTTGSFNGTLNFGGTTLTSSNEDMFVAKYSPAGNLIWVVKSGGTGDASGKRIDVDQWGNIYVGGTYNAAFTLGTTNITGSYDMFYAKFSPSGTVKWVRSYASTSIIYLNDMKVSRNGKIHACGKFTGTMVIGGTTLSASNAYSNIYILRLDSAGLPHWAVSSGGVYDENAYGLDIDLQGNTYVTGEHFCNGYQPTSLGSQSVACGGTYSGLFLTKLDSTGVFLWARSAQASGNVNTIGTDVAADANGNIYVLGWTTGTTNVNFPPLPLINNNSYASFIVKCNPFGFGIWSTTTGARHEELILSGAQFWVAGESQIQRRDTAGGAIISTISPGVYVESLCLDPTSRLCLAGFFGGFITLNTSYNSLSPRDGIVAKYGGTCNVSGNVSPSGNVSICGGQPTTLAGSGGGGTGPYIYNWSTGATTSSISVSTAGTFTVTVTDIGGCSGTASVNVTTNSTPATPVITPAGPTTFCTGGNVTLNSSAPSGNIWSNGATTQSITVSSAGNYTVMAVANGCSSATSSPVLVTVNNTPSTPVVTPAGPTTFCAGGNVTLNSTATSGNVWSNGATTQSITVSASGSYTVMEVANGCSSATSNPVVVTVNSIPSTPLITPNGPTAFCAGGNVTLVSSAPSGNVWSNGATTQSVTVSTAGNYTVMAVANGCSSATSSPVAVTVSNIPSTPSVTPNGPTTFCAGGTVTLSSTAPSGNVWSNGATTQSITVSASGTYTVMEVANGCSSATSTPVVVTVNSVPSTPLITPSGPTTFCAGGNVTLVSSAPNGNIWSNGATSPSITVSTTGNFTVMAVANGCSSATSAPVAVTVNPSPSTPTVTAAGPTTFCQGGTVVLISSAGSGNVWSNGSTSQSITVNSTGSYSVMEVANGCSSNTSIPVVVTVNPPPTTPIVTASGVTTFCDGGTVVLSSSAPTGNQWSDGSTGQFITVTASGVYTVYQVAAGCTSSVSSPVIVTVTPVPATPTITASGPTTFCEGGSVTLLSNSPSGNLWTDGSTTSTINVTTTGVFAVSVSANGCTSLSSTPVQVIVNANPAAPTITQSGNTLTASPAASSYQWFINGNLIPGATAQSHVTSQSGMYTVQVTDVNGCTSMQSTAFIFTGRLDQMNAGISIYPNPSSGFVNLDFSSAGIEACELTLRSYNGALIWARPLKDLANSAVLSLDLGEIADGVYLLHVNSEKGMATFKLIVQR